jgi:hypothetical protein
MRELIISELLLSIWADGFGDFDGNYIKYDDPYRLTNGLEILNLMTDLKLLNYYKLNIMNKVR